MDHAGRRQLFAQTIVVTLLLAALLPATKASGSTLACYDGSYSLEGFKWTSTYKWYFKSRSTPSNISRSDARSALQAAVTNITRADNSCGLPDRVSATASYQGRTRRSANISSGGRCGSRDGRSVVDFGTLPSGILGYTCWWTRSGRAVEADVRLNKAYYRWTVKITSTCWNKFSVQNAATHELGHAFGLWHLSASLHPALSMSTLMLPCSNAKATLALGDIRGLQALY